MKFYIKLAALNLFFIAVFCLCNFQSAFADEKDFSVHKPTVAVITDINHRAGTIYLVTGASTDIIASDIITKLNESNLVYAPVLGESMSKISKHFDMYTSTFFNEYKYNYNVDFVNLKRITQELQADYILMVTSGLDVQSNFLKDTIWNKLAIAGMDPVKPTYRLTTLITLVDPNAQAVLWQQLYKKDITANNYDIGVVQFAPSYAQLSKIKKYSQRVAEHVTPIVNVRINPALAPKKEVRAVEFKSKDITEDKRIYYPVIHSEKFKKPKQYPEPQYMVPQQEQYIEDVNNFTPKTPQNQYSPEQTNSDPIEPVNSQETEKPQLKPAVDYKKKETLPKYDWNLKNIYSSWVS